MTAKVDAMTGQDHATYNTRQAPTTCANSAASSSSPNPRTPPLLPARPRRPDHIGPWSPSGTTFIARSWPASRSAGTTRPHQADPVDQDYQHLRTDMAALFRHLGIQPGPAAA